MALYLIVFNDEWVPDLTLEEVRERGRTARAVIEEMTVAVFSSSATADWTRRQSCAASPRAAAHPYSPTDRTSRPRSTSAVSRSSMCPTMPRRGIGPAGSRSRSAGPRRCTASRIALG